MGVLLTQPVQAQTTSPYIVSSPTTGGGLLPVSASGFSDIVTTLPGTYNPASPFLDTGLKTTVTIDSSTAIIVDTTLTADPALQVNSGVLHILGSITTTGTTPESAIVGTNVTVLNCGTISGGASGVVIAGGRVNNYGSITGMSQYGVTGSPTVNNYGTITSSATAFATYSAVNLGLDGTFNNYGGIVNSPTTGVGRESYNVTFTGAGNTASLSGLSRFNGATIADLNGGNGDVTDTIDLNFIGGTASPITTVGGISSFSIGGYTYSFTNFGTVVNNSRSLASLGATPNEQAAGSGLDGAINQANTANIQPANLATIDNTLTALYFNNPAAVSTALSELSPEKFAHFASSTAFNNASFETQAMDDYLGSQRNGPQGSFSAGSGQIDASGLTLNDPNYDSGLQLVHSRMLAWNAAPDTGSGLLSDMLTGVNMADKKDMKDVKQTAETCASNNPWNVFIRGNVILAQGFSQVDQPHFDDNTESVVVGTDYRFSPNFLVGATLAYAHTDVTLDTDNSSATVDSYSPGVYAMAARVPRSVARYHHRLQHLWRRLLRCADAQSEPRLGAGRCGTRRRSQSHGHRLRRLHRTGGPGRLLRPVGPGRREDRVLGFLLKAAA